MKREDYAGYLATAVLLADLCASLGEASLAQQLSQLLDQARQGLPPETWAELTQDPEAVRRKAISAARARLAEAGRGLYDPIV